MTQDLRFIQLEIFRFLYENKINNSEEFIKLLEKWHAENKILGDLENHIFIFFRFLKNTPNLTTRQKQDWELFEKDFHILPNDIENIKRWIPQFVYDIILNHK